MDIHCDFEYSSLGDHLLYAVIPVTIDISSIISIQVDPRCYKCEVTSYYLCISVIIPAEALC